jgi:hypothetical protein
MTRQLSFHRPKEESRTRLAFSLLSRMCRIQRKLNFEQPNVVPYPQDIAFASFKWRQSILHEGKKILQA